MDAHIQGWPKTLDTYESMEIWDGPTYVVKMSDFAQFNSSELCIPLPANTVEKKPCMQHFFFISGVYLCRENVLEEGY